MKKYGGGIIMADKKCKSCGEWVAKETVICPICHEKASWSFISLAHPSSTIFSN
jgi:uncharacterized OB-fold protein